MNKDIKCVLIDPENILFPAEELYKDCINLAFADVTKGKVRFDKNQVKTILLGNSFIDIVEFASSFKPQKYKLTEEERKFIIKKLFEYTERFLIKGKYAGTNKTHLEILRWFTEAGIKVCVNSNMSYEILMKYLDATGYLSLIDYVVTPDKLRVEQKLLINPKPSKDMYNHILAYYDFIEDDLLTIEGTLGGITASKFSNINCIICKNPDLFKLKQIIQGMEKMEVLTFQ